LPRLERGHTNGVAPVEPTHRSNGWETVPLAILAVLATLSVISRIVLLLGR